MGVFKCKNKTEWAESTSIITKKNGNIFFIFDFRDLNKTIKSKIFPIPKMHDMLFTQEGFKLASSLDLNMG